MSYQWRIKGLYKGVTPDVAAAEIERIQSVYGKITPDIIVKEASDEGSPLHPCFTWENDKAADNYRLIQARTLLNNIQVVVLSDGEPREVSVYEVVSREEGYKSIETFTSENIEYVRAEIKRQLYVLNSKLRLYNNFGKVQSLITQAIEEIEE